MDEYIYSESTQRAFLNDTFFFKDPKLKKYFDRDETGDLSKFRSRVKSAHGDKSYEKLVYVLVTDAIRDIILDTVGELTVFMKSMGDLIVSGGEAYNLYTPYNQHIVTSDIDAKFVPRLPMNTQFFGKLQAIKLILWNKLGEIAKRLDTRVRDRILSKKGKIHKYLGIGFKQKGPYVTRRYTLIRKKKVSNNNTPGAGDIFIDVELFALDLNIRLLNPVSGKIENVTMGGILDIPFMRPNEFGYEVILTRRKGVTYRNVNTGKLITNNKIYVASKEFLIEDIYLMHKLNIRPDKKEKDRQRLTRLAKLFIEDIPGTLSIEDIFMRVKPKLTKRGTPAAKKNAKVPMNRAKQVNPRKYESFTTKPSVDRLSRQFVHGLKPVVVNTKVSGYERSSGNKRFNLKTLTWKNVTNDAYVRNEFILRPEKALPLPKDINLRKTLFGYRPKRNNWIPGEILNRAAVIPFVGLKK